MSFEMERRKMNNLAVLENNKIEIRKPGRLDQNPAAVYLASLSKRSRRVQLDALNIIANILNPGANYLEIPWHEIEYQHAQAIRSALIEEDYSAASANRMLSAMRETIHQAWLLELTTAENYLRVKEVKNFKGSTVPAGRAITSGEKNALINACSADDNPAGYRDAAIIALMVTAGPRRAEVVGIDLEDYDPENGQLKILGKGNKERTTYLANGTLAAMADWLQVRGSEPGPLFIPIDRHNNMVMRRLTTQAIYNMLNKRIEEAAIKDFSPHDLRRTFISDMLDAGADIATVAKMVGHASVTTTARYDRRPEKAKQKAAELLTVPYKRRLSEI